MKRETVLAILLVAEPAVPSRCDEGPWYSRAIVGIEVGPTGAQFGHSDMSDGRYCSKFDGREIVRKAVAAQSEYVVMWARDGDYAYYDSALLPKAPGLAKRDPLREAVVEAKRQKVPLIAYCVVQQGGHYLKAHPEFEMRGVDGQPLGRFCFRSGYLDAMKAIVAEQLAYGIDGFHIDMLDQGFGPPYGCWCESCRAAFQERFGRAMPTGVTWDEDWDRMLEFRYSASDEFEKSLAAHIRGIDPKATVDFNYHGNPPFSFEVGQRPVQHAGNGDFVTGETGVWGFSALTVGLNAAFYRAATPDKRFQVAMQRGVRMYHDQTTRPLADIRWELFTLLSHGAFVTMVDKTGFDGWLDPVAYDRIGSAFEEARAKRDHFGHDAVAEVGIYFSHRTRDWVGRESPGSYFEAFQGAHKALVQEHIPFGVLLDESATLERLRPFRVVFLANAAILSTEELGRLRDYVAEGGHLILTGRSGCRDRFGVFRPDPPMAELIGARCVEELESADNWVRLSSNSKGTEDRSDFGEAISQDIRSDWPFLVKGPAVVYEPTTAVAYGDLLRPYRTTNQRLGKEGTEWPMSAEDVVGPAVLLHRVGKGTVLTFASSPDAATASEHSILEARRLIRNAVRWLIPDPVIRVQAPASVEVVVTDDVASRTLRVHLLGYNAPAQTTPSKGRPMVLPALIEDAPMYRLQLESNRPLENASSVGSKSVLKRVGNRVEATIEDIHEVLLLEYAAPEEN